MQSWEEGRIRAAASTASINKTLNDIDAILDGTNLPKEGAKREELRERLRSALEEVAKVWIQDGFKGGHIFAIRSLLESGRIQQSISKTIRRKYPGQNEESQLLVKSALPVDLATLSKEWRGGA